MFQKLTKYPARSLNFKTLQFSHLLQPQLRRNFPDSGEDFQNPASTIYSTKLNQIG
ncbi:hypothetical protein LINGRAPRIM_LOCUS2541 [Linum grandiflorum]